MISHKYKFICFRMPKIASCSLRDMLKPYTNKILTIRSDVKYQMRHFERYNLNKILWNQYFKFAFVRNPWSRMVSRYFYFLNHGALGNIHIYPNEKDNFCSFVENFDTERRRSNVYQYNFLTDIHGKIQTNFIGRFESFAEDFNIICEKIGLNKIKIKHLNKTKHKHYTEYYNKESIEIVRNKFKKDIDYFGYKFND